MSQFKFETDVLEEGLVEVMFGYDRPLQHYFCTVFFTDPNSESEVFWSSLDDLKSAKGGYFSFKTVVEKLSEIGISIPEKKQVEKLVCLRQGNSHYTFDKKWKKS